MNLILDYLGLAGAFAMAVSGALTAMQKKFDIFGIFIIAFVTAVGGGTLRDILINGRSVFWLDDLSYIYTIIWGTIFAVVFRNYLSYLRQTFFIFDAVGLALFTVLGVQIGIDFNLNFLVCIILGTVTGAFGGILRDIFVGDVPIIFKQEIYATISIFGGILFYLLNSYCDIVYLTKILPIVFIIVSRVIAAYYKIHLPNFSLKENN